MTIDIQTFLYLDHKTGIMDIQILEPRKALNKAFLKIKPIRTKIEDFKFNLIAILDAINEKEREEFHKNLVIAFLKNTYYDPNHFVNTKGSNDLVIHNGKDAKSSVGVIVEVKNPSNKAEMVSTTNLNAKALHELVYYYMRERITHKNTDLKNLVVTNIYEWFVFDAQLFNKVFADNKQFVKQFIDFEEGRASGNSTDYFYKEIAKPFIASVETSLQYNYFDIRKYDKQLRNNDKSDDKSLIALFKLLSPEHLLKLSFANDSNSLDKNFYNELLHIIGLTEIKEGGKKLIERNKKGSRNDGSLLENAILQLDSEDKLNYIPNLKQYGENKEAQLFAIGLELTITWVNRILFLKLLEAQLITYHKGDKSYSFLNFALIKDYDILNNLFFKVLAKKPSDRIDRITKDFDKVPYLNSSLFETTELERFGISIAQLEDNVPIPLLSNTVIKDSNGKKVVGNKNPLDYFLSFLDAYDFASEGSEEIQEDNKTLINASVLGLIFEKINGYKDGSFFTPSFITMYMCKETIRRAVLQKFNETLHWACADFSELYNNIKDKPQANAVINSLKICDPAVGSGHFLVSALNEIIAIKHDLGILTDKHGKTLRDYSVEVVNDELMINDDDGVPFQYNATNKESQRIQETLFHEKQTIIENCLFGVDINPNSVKICRLRLWIELLKNAYYKTDSNELETLPNIDINIKCGNSLISRFALDADLKKALKQSKWNIESYKLAVATYRDAESKEQKHEMEALIADIKGNFRSEINGNDPKKLKLEKKKGELFNYTQQTGLFERSKKEQADWNKKVNSVTVEIKALDAEIEEIKSNKIYENAFEWRFEFPEVLNDAGDFVGFDVVIGNPPYGVNFNEVEKKYLSSFDNLVPDFEIYIYFISLAKSILDKRRFLSYIFPNTFLSTTFGKKYRERLLNETQVYQIVDLSNDNTFEDASVRTCIFSFKNHSEIYSSSFLTVNNKEFYVKENFDKSFLLTEVENLLSLFHQNKSEISIIKKIRKHQQLKEFFEVSQGYIPYRRSDLVKKHGEIEGNNIIDNRLWHSSTQKDSTWKKEILGKNVNRYSFARNDSYIFYGKHVASYVDEKFFNNARILIREITAKNLFCTYIEEEFFNNPSLINLINEKGNLELKYVLGILNSNLIGWLHNKVSPKANKGLFPKILINDVRIIPIPEITFENQQPFIEKVNQILTLKQQNPQADTSILENEIDQLVYELYGLTKDEIAIVESSS